MTPNEWDECVNPLPMLDFLGDRASDRKLRLFGVRIALQVRRIFSSEQDREWIRLAEMYADQAVDRGRLAAAREEATERITIARELREPRPVPLELLSEAFRNDQAKRWATFLARCCGNDESQGPEVWLGHSAEIYRPRQASCVRDIFDHLLHPVEFDPACRSVDVVSLANTIYDNRQFGTMPILSDALLDAGCNSEAIIRHCRTDKPHARGCWVLDLILERK